ncbi:MAG: NAD(P)/FAD-dependent oxidoreductase [Saprospiraceae bacterium]|nr:NAD(P)/FAD-dependent oxidoreductase [Saprospiraceae bacterium]
MIKYDVIGNKTSQYHFTRYGIWINKLIKINETIRYHCNWSGVRGLVAATTAHRKGLKTALIEKNKIGGECTHYGCVPSKALINTSKAYHGLRKMSSLGISVDLPKPDFREIMEKVDEIVQGIYKHEKPEVFQDQGIDVFVNKSGAKFIDEHTITVGDEIINAKNFVICTGSSPRLLDVEGIDQVKMLHNENFWELREKPDSIVFIGGGVISTELAQALNRLDCSVSIIDRNSRILKVTEEEIGGYLCDKLKNEGLTILTDASPLRFEDKNTLEYLQNGEKKKIEADYFFTAAGRLPNVKGLQLENAAVEYTNQGITTNEFLQSTASHIYASGDVTAS